MLSGESGESFFLMFVLFYLPLGVLVAAFATTALATYRRRWYLAAFGLAGMIAVAAWGALWMVPGLSVIATRW